MKIAKLMGLLVLGVAAGVCSAQAHEAGEMHHDKPPVPPSRTLTVRYAEKVLTMSLADLQGMPQTTVRVHNAHSNKDESYGGPLLSAVLERAGLVASPKTEHELLHAVVVASATDNYWVSYSAAEVEPMLSHGQVIVALTKDGGPDVQGGLIQLIGTEDAKPARWVHGLKDVHVVALEGK